MAFIDLGDRLPDFSAGWQLAGGASNTQRMECFGWIFNAAIAAQAASEKKGLPWPRDTINIRGGGDIDAHNRHI
jgi:hypothetical protein